MQKYYLDIYTILKAVDNRSLRHSTLTFAFTCSMWVNKLKLSDSHVACGALFASDTKLWLLVLGITKTTRVRSRPWIFLSRVKLQLRTMGLKTNCITPPFGNKSALSDDSLWLDASAARPQAASAHSLLAGRDLNITYTQPAPQLTSAMEPNVVNKRFLWRYWKTSVQQDFKWHLLTVG